MEFNYVETRKQKQRFLEFSHLVYKGNPFYRDSMSEIVKLFLDKKTAFLNHSEILPFVIEEAGRILLRAAFIIDHKLKNTLMISFFEARENVQDAVNLMLDKGKQLARARGLQKIIVGLDAHLNYGVGFLASHYEQPPCFGLGYTPKYYLDYFQGLKEFQFTSILVDIDRFNFDQEGSILKRLKNRGFNFRPADFKQLDREIGIFTYLNNLGYQGHLWWAERTFAEDKELLYPFRWFIRDKNLIIAEKAGEPIGLLFWYPDFNQLVSAGQSLGVTTLLKYKFRAGKLDRFKIANIVIKPEYQGTGVILGLFDYLFHLVKDRYSYGLAGWIAADNSQSRGFGSRWQALGCQEYIQYKAFELELKEVR